MGGKNHANTSTHTSTGRPNPPCPDTFGEAIHTAATGTATATATATAAPVGVGVGVRVLRASDLAVLSHDGEVSAHDVQRGVMCTDLTWKKYVNDATGVCGVAHQPSGCLHEAHHHTHPEFFFALQGKALTKCGGEWVEVDRHDLVFCPPSVEHCTKAVGATPFVCLYMFPEGPSENIEYKYAPYQNIKDSPIKTGTRKDFPVIMKAQEPVHFHKVIE